MITRLRASFNSLQKDLANTPRLGEQCEFRYKISKLADEINRALYDIKEEQEQKAYVALYHDVELFRHQLIYEKNLLTDEYFYQSYLNSLQFLIQNDIRPAFKASVALELMQTLLLCAYPYLSANAIRDLKLYYPLIQDGTDTQKTLAKALLNEALRQEKSELPSIKNLQQAYQQLILASIASQGLQSSPQQLLQNMRSVDEGSGGSYMSVNSVNLFPIDESTQKKSKAQLKPILKYLKDDMYAGYLQIAMERGKGYKFKPKTSTELQAILEGRLAASLIFIANDKALHYPSWINSATAYEQRIEEVLPQHIQAILAPEGLVSLVQALFPDKSVIAVPLITQKVMPSDSIMENITIQGENFSNNKLNLSLNIPDYERGLRTYIDTYQPQRFMVHITRLASAHDMSLLLTKPQSLDISYLSYEEKRERYDRPTLSFATRSKLWDKMETNRLALLPTLPQILFKFAQRINQQQALIQEADDVLFYVRNGFTLK